MDTSFVLDLWDEKPEAVAKARQIDARGEMVYLPTPAFFELCEGVAPSGRPRDEAAKGREFTSGHELLPFGKADALEAGLLLRRLSRTGRLMGTVDVEIAGMAKAREQTLLATDRRFPELSAEIRVEAYPKAT